MAASDTKADVPAGFDSPTAPPQTPEQAIREGPMRHGPRLLAGVLLAAWAVQVIQAQITSCGRGRIFDESRREGPITPVRCPRDPFIAPIVRARIDALGDTQRGRYDVQIVVADGLNALALTDAGHLPPYLAELRRLLIAAGMRPAPEHVVVTHGRVRAGYRIGETLFGRLAPDSAAAMVHVIGERPGNGHHTFSSYITTLPARVWATPGVVDHHHTKVISNIADTALDPALAARQTAALLSRV
jgi:hypothetical protein